MQHKLTTLLLASALALVSGVVADGPLEIELSKRGQVARADGSIDLAVIDLQNRYLLTKLDNGFEAYKANTGSDHPLDRHRHHRHHHHHKVGKHHGHKGQHKTCEHARDVVGEGGSFEDPEDDGPEVEEYDDDDVEDFEDDEDEDDEDEDDGSQPSKRSTTGSISLTDMYDVLWLGSFKAGTPVRTFQVLFDTGSSDVVLPDKNCKSTNGGGCGAPKSYDHSASSTSKSLNKNFHLAYGDGSTVSGKQYKDTVQFSSFKVTNQVLGSATSASPDFFTTGLGGIVGMGFKQISQTGSNPPVLNLASESSSFSPIVAFKLVDPSTGGSSSLTFGGTNKALYTGSPTYVPVTQVGFWQVTLAAVKVNGQSVSLGTDAAIVDSGTSLIVGPKSAVTKFYSHVSGSKPVPGYDGLYTIPCNSFPSSVSFKLGSKTINIKKSTFNLGALYPGSSDCVAGLQYLSGAPFWILGDVLMQNTYTIFDAKSKRVGFATLK